jgi:hypothetical protein
VVQFQSGKQCWVTGCLFPTISGLYSGLNFMGQMSSEGKKFPSSSLDALKLRPAHSVEMLGDKRPVVYRGDL